MLHNHIVEIVTRKGLFETYTQVCIEEGYSEVQVFALILYGHKQAAYKELFKADTSRRQLEDYTSSRWLLVTYDSNVENFEGVVGGNKEVFNVDSLDNPVLIVFTESCYKVMELENQTTAGDALGHVSEISKVITDTMALLDPINEGYDSAQAVRNVENMINKKTKKPISAKLLAAASSILFKTIGLSLE